MIMSDTTQTPEESQELTDEAVAAAGASDEETQGYDTEDGEAFVFDMSEVKPESGFPLLPQGNWPAVIDEVTFGRSQTSGNRMFTIKWSFTGDNELAQKNRKATSWHVLEAEQRGRFKAILEKIHPDLAGAKEFNPKQIADENLLVGTEATLVIRNRKNREGEMQSNVSDVKAPGSAGASNGADSSSSEFQL